MAEAHDVEIWWLDTSALAAAERARLAATLSSDERERCAALRREADRAEFVAAHGLARLLIGHALDVEERALRFARDRYGRPSLVEPGGVSFNLSHSDGLVVVALRRRGAVGVDVESLRRAVDPLELARAAFSPEEQGRLLALDEGDRREAFFRLWTLKEAYLKARGLGLSLEPRSFSIALAPALALDPPPEDERRWQLFGAMLGPAHLLASCAEVLDDEEVRFTLHDGRDALSHARPAP